MDHIAKTTIYLKDVKPYEVMRQTEYEYYQQYAPGLVEEPPASTFIMPAWPARSTMLFQARPRPGGERGGTDLLRS
jgi:hypothetical protein